MNNIMKLRDWQKRGYSFFKKHNNCIMEVATGAGKTYMAIYIIKKKLEINPNIKILIIGPKNVILENTWLSELNLYGFPINKVGIYNGRIKEFSQITLTSIQSLHRMVDTGIYNSFDFIIFDELHNYGSKSYLDLTNIKCKYKLGLTATLERQDMKQLILRKYFDYNIFKYNIKEALKDNVLNPFDFYIIKIKMDPEIRKQYLYMSELIKEEMLKLNMRSLKKLNPANKKQEVLYKYVKNRQELINNYSIKKDIVKKLVIENRNNKVLVFNQYNHISTILYWELIDYNISVDIVNSTIYPYLRDKILKRFEEDKINILLATTMLDEGYNLPKIDVAILMAQNSTDKQFIQRMGRVLRKKENNSKVYYLVVEGTFEEENFEKREQFIKEIANNYIERYIQ